MLKPCPLDLLVSRVEALLRRTEHLFAEDRQPAISLERTRRQPLTLGPLHLNPQTGALRAGAGAEVILTRREFDLLLALAERRDQLVARADLHRALTGRAWNGKDRLVDAYVHKVRRKLSALPGGPVAIEGRRSAGYLLVLRPPR